MTGEACSPGWGGGGTPLIGGDRLSFHGPDGQNGGGARLPPIGGTKNRHTACQMAPLRVLVADDHPLILLSLAGVVQAHPELELAARAATGDEALQAALAERPDLAVLDVQMPGLSGLEVMEAMKRDALPTRVLFVTATVDPAGAYDLVQAGAAGVLEKDATPAMICDALLRIAGRRPGSEPRCGGSRPARPCSLPRSRRRW